MIYDTLTLATAILLGIGLLGGYATVLTIRVRRV